MSDAGWDDVDRAVQVEDENAEALAGAEVDFDEAADDWRAAGPAAAGGE